VELDMESNNNDTDIFNLTFEWEENITPEKLAGIWAKRAEALAQPPPVEATGLTIHLLTFLMGAESYGIDVSFVHEIYPLGQVTLVPRTPNFVVGIFNARGKLISLIDLCSFLGLPNIKQSQENKIVVVGNNHLEVGFLVNEVVDVAKVYRNELASPFAGQATAQSKYTLGIGPEMLIVLDVNLLLQDPNLIVDQSKGNVDGFK